MVHRSDGNPAGDEAALVAALSARLCHDLAGQLGTLAGMIELAQEELPQSEALGVAAEAAARAVARVRFLRAAWGGDAGPMNAAGLAALAAGVPGGERLMLDCHGIAGELPDPAARLVLCVLPVAALAGARALSLEGDALGVTARLSGGAWPAADDGSPRLVALRVLRVVAAAAGWTIDIEASVMRLSPLK